jgi:hypothetical protein
MQVCNDVSLLLYYNCFAAFSLVPPNPCLKLLAQPRSAIVSTAASSFCINETYHRIIMSLILTIFALVFITELISWIGQSVLLELVRCFLDSLGSDSKGENPRFRHGVFTAEYSWVLHTRDSVSSKLSC